MNIRRFMNTKSLAYCFIFAASVSALNATAMSAPNNDVTLELADLKPVESSHFDEFLVLRDSSLRSYNKFYIEQPTATFNKRWLRDNRNDVDSRYKARIIENYTRELKTQLVKAIEGHENASIVKNKEADVLTIRASLADLNINGPDSNALVRHFVNKAGHATLSIELIDSNNKVVGVIKDHQETRYRGFNGPRRTSRVENHRDFRILMSRWSKDVLNSLSSL